MSRIFTQWSLPFNHPSHPCLLFFTLLLTIGVRAADDPVFHIECPPDVTVDCDDEIWDLSIYGTATIYGYGSPQPAGPPESEVYNLNNCGTGTIVRTWVAYDYSGTAFSCSQTIYVGGSGYVDITWPWDYIIHTCDPNPPISPNVLPPPYDFPVVNAYGNSCSSQIMMNYEDMVFEINPPACTKILRKWTVIDWCQYNPNAYNPQGIWEHTQLIKIKPENPPVIYCFSDTTVSAGADCTGGHVDLPLVTGASDCGAGVTITNHSPYAYSNGADASGFYPLGTTKVVFTADDGCGGKTTCSVYITVQDMKKPTPICYYGISVSLMSMPDGYYMTLQPQFFDKGSFDNCTPKEYLTFEMVPSRVTCADLGETPVQMFVTDLAGNTQYCNTVVHVQDNMGMCPPTDGIVGGVVHSMDGVMLEDIEVTLSEMDEQAMTNADGEYSFPVVPFGHTYTVAPLSEVEDMDGVTTLDLVILLKHILGIEQLDNPYLHVAGDLDASGWISVNDLLALKDLILRNHYDLPASTSWKFIDDSFEFDPVNPLSQPIPESYVIDMFMTDMTQLDFVGVKMGDLSGDANLPSNIAAIETRSGQSVSITASTEGTVEIGQEYEVTITSEEFAAITAYQLTLSVDPAVATILEVIPGDLPGLEQSSFGLRNMESGVITSAWFDLKATGAEKSTLMTLKLRANTRADLHNVISLQTDPTPVVAYNESYESLDIHLNYDDLGLSPTAPQDMGGLVVGQNYPNPFDGMTLIPVNLPAAAKVDLEVFDSNGRKLMEKTVAGQLGLQEIALNINEIGATGLLFCRISTSTHSASIRILAAEAR